MDYIAELQEVEGLLQTYKGRLKRGDEKKGCYYVWPIP